MKILTAASNCPKLIEFAFNVLLYTCQQTILTAITKLHTNCLLLRSVIISSTGLNYEYVFSDHTDTGPHKTLSVGRFVKSETEEWMQYFETVTELNKIELHVVLSSDILRAIADFNCHSLTYLHITSRNNHTADIIYLQQKCEKLTTLKLNNFNDIRHSDFLSIFQSFNNLLHTFVVSGNDYLRIQTINDLLKMKTKLRRISLINNTHISHAQVLKLKSQWMGKIEVTDAYEI